MMKPKLTWSIIKFPDDGDSVEAVPTRWLIGNKCKWPPYPPNSQKLMEAIEKNIMPNDNWQEFHIIPLRNNVYDDYLTARKKVKKAMETSDLESDTPLMSTKRKIKFKRTYSFSSVEEEFSLPEPPSMEKLINPPTINNDEFQSFDICRDMPSSSGETQCRKSVVKVHSQEVPKSKSTHNENLVEAMVDTLPTAAKSQSTNQKEIDIKDVYNLVLRLTRKQELLQLMVSDIKDSLNKIESTLSHDRIDVELETVESISAKFNLPIDGNEQLQEFEIYLKENEKAFKKAIHEISLLGGKHLYDFISRAGKTLITNSFASQFSYLGKRQKEGFKILMLNKLLTESAMRLHKEVTIKEVEVEISKWLKRAAERAKKEIKK